MRVINQSIEFVSKPDGEILLDRIEIACRNCYKSEGANANHDPAKRNALIANAIRRGHHSVLEHGNIMFRVITNRGVTHEWVRHRIGVAYSQESTRYCNYGNSEVVFIRPHWMTETALAIAKQGTRGVEISALEYGSDPIMVWLVSMYRAERAYLALLERGLKAQDARGVLPNDLKTELITTMNIRAIRHFIQLRGDIAAHPQIRELALEMLSMVSKAIPVLFDDLVEERLNGSV